MPSIGTPERLDPVTVVAVGAELLGADGGEVARVEGQDDAVPAILVEAVLPPAGARQREVGRGVSNRELRHSGALQRDRLDDHRRQRLASRAPSRSIRSTTSNPELTLPSRA